MSPAEKTGPHRVSLEAYDPVEDGSATTTASIQAAIDDVFDRGGGVVCVPPGEYRTGTLELRDSVRLHLQAGATVRGSPDRADYGTDEITGDFMSGVENRDGKHEAVAPLVVADDASGVALTGSGRIDARGEYFWTFEGPNELQRFLPDDRPGMAVRFTDCTDVRIRDVHIENSPAWTLHLRSCEDVSVHNVRIENSVYGPNTDGIDVDACSNVRISDSDIMAGGDDAIVLKNVRKGQSEFPDRPSRNITITNCTLTAKTNAFKIGTENYEGFRDVTLSNSVLRAPVAGVDYEVDERFGAVSGPFSGVSLEMVDGATLEGVSVSNLVMRDVGAPFFVRVGNRPRYRTDQESLEPGRVRNVSISDVVATGARWPSPIAGLPDGPVENVSVSNVRIETAGGETDPAVAEQDVPEGAADYPEANQWGTLPACGFYCRHVDGLSMDAVSVTVTDEDVRPVLDADDVTDLRVRGFTDRSAGSERTLVRLANARRVMLDGVSASGSIGTGVEVGGADSRRITITGCDLTRSDRPVDVGDDVPDYTVQTIGNRRPT